jgi:fructosamine-3-kinase
MRAAVEDVLGDRIAGMSPTSGGSINESWRIELASGAPAFLKYRRGAPAAEFAAEAAGLRWLGEAGATRVPAVLGLGADPPWLALQWVEPGRTSAAGGERLGRSLAELHRAGAPAHGALPPRSPDRILRIGPVELPAVERGAWAGVYAEDRLLPLLRMARAREAIDPAGGAAVERVCERIADLAGPPEPPARLHGDLWSGNVHADAEGEAWLIDPAAHGGHREVDLAMLRLFGDPGERFFEAYSEAHALSAGHAERVSLWQILPLLVHAVLFGGPYGASAAAAARSYL